MNRSSTLKAARAGLVCFAVAAAGCGDSPSAPALVAGPAALEIETGDGQTAAPGQDLPQRPSVLVKDGSGAPLEGATVRFAVVLGGGSIERGTVETDSRGIATAGVWTLGAANGENALEATVDGVQPVRFTAIAESPFTIVARYIGSVTARQREAVDRAIDRWSTAIINDLTDIPLTSSAGECFADQPAIDEQIDDVLILVRFEEIDGEGGTLGQAGPCFIRTTTSLPVMGVLVLDAADLAKLETVGLLDDVVLHEVGHVLGIGSLWAQLGLVSGAGGDDPRFNGPHAMAAYAALGTGGGSVPVENTGANGTRDAHWRETTFTNELMTGFLNQLPNPLSALSVASLKDLGYGTNPLAASDYTLAAATSAVRPAEIAGLDETVVEPKFHIDPRGNRYLILREKVDRR